LREERKQKEVFEKEEIYKMKQNYVTRNDNEKK
jgi:hypothetical protein